MATGTSGSNEDDALITCSICFEIFKTPKYLPCLHTFCETCLNEYITSWLENSNRGTERENECCTTRNEGMKSDSLRNVTDSGSIERSFGCPICRSFVPLPSTTGNATPECLAGRFPTNHLIVTLIDQKKLNTTERSCDICTAMGQNSRAIIWCTDCNEAFCNNCERFHKTLKTSKDHHTLPIEQFQTEQTFITTFDKCNIHKNKAIEFYCVEHDTACCSTCVTVSHRKCEHVQTLEEAARGSRDQSDISDLCETFKEMSTIYESMIVERKNDLEVLENLKQDFHSKIAKQFQEIVTIFNKHLEDVHSRCSKEMKEEISNLGNCKSITDHCQRVSDTCKRSASDIHVFMETKTLSNRQKEQEEILKSKLKMEKHISYELDIEDELSTIKDKIQSIGRVVETTRKPTSMPELKYLKHLSKRNLSRCSAKEVTTFQVSGAGTLSGCCFLPNEKLLLSDNNNKRLLVYDEGGQFHKEIPMPGYPWDITSIDTQEAAVTTVTINSIQFIDTVTLTKGRQITLDGQNLGLAYNGKHLVVGYSNGIALVELNGNVVMRIKTDRSPQYIAIYKDRIFCSAGNNELKCFNTSGTHLFTYSSNDLIPSKGVSCDRDGNIYVALYGSNNIHQLDTDGKLIKIILSSKEGINYPYSIKFHPSADKLLVTCGADKVKIFELLEK